MCGWWPRLPAAHPPMGRQGLPGCMLRLPARRHLGLATATFLQRHGAAMRAKRVAAMQAAGAVQGACRLPPQRSDRRVGSVPLDPAARAGRQAVHQPKVRQTLLLLVVKVLYAVKAVDEHGELKTQCVCWVAGWADVAAALRLRRAELLAKQEALSGQSAPIPAAETAAASATAAVLPNSHSAVEPAAVIDGVRKVAASVATPSVVRPRGGVRQSALGPLLARLRSEPGN